jgi:DNA repair exonuclease SbcCD nuclease subunit
VIRARDLPAGFAGVLSGHIHRHQVLACDLQGRPLRAPVLYPGSIERTSFAEADEPKGFMIVRVSESIDGIRLDWQFTQLPARPMLAAQVDAGVLHAAALDARLRALVAAAPLDAVLKVRVGGSPSPAHLRVMSAAHLRTFVPETMNLDVRAADGSDRMRAVLPRRYDVNAAARRRTEDGNLQLEL